MRFFEWIYNGVADVTEWFRGRNGTDMFIGTVIVLLALRVIGYSGLSVFLALVYIMWFVSVGRR